jgi:hypothetical protein
MPRAVFHWHGLSSTAPARQLCHCAGSGERRRGSGGRWDTGTTGSLARPPAGHGSMTLSTNYIIMFAPEILLARRVNKCIPEYLTYRPNAKL